MNLLSEHEITRLIRLVKQMADRMGVEESRSPDPPELERDVHPERVLEHIARVTKEEADRPVVSPAGDPPRSR